MRRERQGLALCSAAAVGAGSVVAVSGALTRYPVYGGQALRYAVAAAVLLALARRPGRRPWRPTRGDLARLGALAATGLAGFNVCVVEAVRRADPSVVGVVVGGAPLMLAVAGPLSARRRPRPRTVGAAAVVVAGAALAQGLGDSSPAGLAFAAGALAGEVLFSLLAVPLLPRLGPAALSAYAYLAAVPLLVGVGLVMDGAGLVRLLGTAEVLALGWQSLVVTALAFLAWYVGLARLSVERAGLTAGLIPVSAVGCARLLGTGRPGLAAAAGALLVGVGVVVGVSGGRTERGRVEVVRVAPGG